MSAGMTPERYAGLRDYSQRVGRSDDEAEVSKADLADLITMIDSSELAIARVRELASPDWCLSVPGGVKQAILDRIGGTA